MEKYQETSFRDWTHRFGIKHEAFEAARTMASSVIDSIVCISTPNGLDFVQPDSTWDPRSSAEEYAYSRLDSERVSALGRHSPSRRKKQRHLNGINEFPEQEIIFAASEIADEIVEER